MFTYEINGATSAQPQPLGSIRQIYVFEGRRFRTKKVILGLIIPGGGGGGDPLGTLDRPITFETCSGIFRKTGKVQDKKHFEILCYKNSLMKAMHHLVFY